MLTRLLQGVTQRLKEMTAEELNESLIEDAHVDHKDEERAIEQNIKQKNGTASASVSSCACPEPKPVEQTWWLNNLCLDRSRLTIIGFSKGCVVLNQLLYEFHYTKTLTPEDKEALRFMGNIDSMYWLDGGHAGSKNTWLTSRSLLETLARLDINVFVHVSPYQVLDDRRPWIGREERSFVTLLTKLGAKVKRYMHVPLDSGSSSLPTHFSVLTNFKSIQEDHGD
ncbi:UPF0565 protein C2orf69 homolog [Eumeta japonica]|uniref:UPF0565 protein C2orf69 homolog n=1 Tax=Eumeta variegata TaxID=151549 RepID=A0A4C1WN77_EUMVA|nr:UPF0565 protein C2orf69 homolog [Eumeta japonica]